MPTRKQDPYTGYSFLVEIDGVTQAGFMECTGLGSHTDVIEYREGTDASTVRKLPGLTRYSNIVLRWGVTQSTELLEWRKTVIEGRVERKHGAIILLDDRQGEMARWVFQHGWPSRMSGPELNAMTSAVAIEELEICHEGVMRAGSRTT